MGDIRNSYWPQVLEQTVAAPLDAVRYVAEGSFDAYSWQTVLTKAKFIAQVMSGEQTELDVAPFGPARSEGQTRR